MRRAKPLKAFDCSLCSDSKHVFNKKKNTWIKCSCLVKSISDSKYRDAGIPERFKNCSWKTMLGTHRILSKNAFTQLMKSCGEMRKGVKSELWFTVFSHSHTTRTEVNSLILRSACDGGLSARGLDIQALIDMEFEKTGDRYKTADVLCITCGSEPSHKWNKHVLESVLKKRWGLKLFTVLICEVKPSSLNTIYGSSRIESFIEEDFREVSLEPK